jgi:hypothetical protein
LLKSLQQVGDAEEMEVHALLEVNISGDASKHGLTAGELPEIIERLPALSRVHVGGLMAMGGRTAAEVEVRAQFAAVRQLRDELSANAPEGVSLAELSMGMSGDYEIAIEEGATLVRVGSVLFEESEPGL